VSAPLVSEHDTSIRRNMGDTSERGGCGTWVPPCGSFSYCYYIEAALYHEMFVPVYSLYFIWRQLPEDCNLQLTPWVVFTFRRWHLSVTQWSRGFYSTRHPGIALKFGLSLGPHSSGKWGVVWQLVTDVSQSVAIHCGENL